MKGRQQGVDPHGHKGQDHTASNATTQLKATSKQATKVKAAWRGKAFGRAFPAQEGAHRAHLALRDGLQRQRGLGAEG